MGAASLTCDRCRTRLPVSALNRQGLVACPGCRTPLRFLVFPAYYRAHAPAQAGESIMIEGESSCFYHPTKKAVVPCEGCGRFLCALCDVDIDARHLCPKCLEAGKEKRTMDTIESERYLYDALALGLSGGGLLLMLCMPYVAVFTAPAAIFISIRHWNKPLSLLSPSKWRFILAIILAAGEIGIAILVLAFMVVGIYSSR